MDPIDLLKEKLMAYTDSLRKSKESYAKGEITKDLHEVHKENLDTLIAKYKHAIQTLKIFG